MIIEKVIREVTKQWKDIHMWMQSITVSYDVLKENNTIQTTKIAKILKRVARIEDKLNIINIEEKE